jgi:transposase
MFFRDKRVGNHSYLLLVENKRVNGKTQQHVIANLGHLDQLRESGKLDDLISSAAKFSENIMIFNALKEGLINEISKLKIGGPLIFDRIWRETGCCDIIREHIQERKIQFDLERVIFTTVLHRLFDPGSDRACEKWMKDYSIRGVEGIQLQHFYRAMGWLGEDDGDSRIVKDSIEEALYQKRRDIFTTVDMVFFDTTSVYFEGEGGETIGQYGNSKDHRSDLKQLVVGAVLDNNGHPICCELWPGNMADVKSLIPVADRLKKRFGLNKSCIVADRGMISSYTIDWLESDSQQRPYILGARMRRQKEVREEVLTRAGRYEEVYGERKNPGDPSPLKVKEVWVENRRYIVCHNEDQAEKDRKDRDIILKSLEEALKKGSKSVVSNKGYRKYIKNPDEGFEINYDKVKEEEKYDGKWVLRTNTDLPAREVALKYKQLWMVEDLFRSLKSVLSTRPIYHKCDDTIRGHVFCSFLAMVLMKELNDRIENKGWSFEWKDIIRDLDNLEELELEQASKRFVMRIGLTGCAGKIFQAAGVALPPVLRKVSENK